MQDHVIRHFGFLKSTAIGGVLFLLPVIVVGYLLSQVGGVVFTIATFLNDQLGIKTAYGYGVLLSASIAVLIGLCFAAGVAAQLAIGKKISGTVEKHLTLIFPRYSIYKDQVAGGIGGQLAKSRMSPVLIEIMGVTRPALEIERGSDDTVTVYFPGAPDPWSGTFGFVRSDQVRPVEVDLGEFLATFERLGRDAQPLILRRETANPSPAHHIDTRPGSQ